MRRSVLYKGFNDLRAKCGHKHFNNPYRLKLTHVQVLVKFWEESGLSSASIQNSLSIFRTFAKWIGKEGLIPGTEELVSDPAKAKRSYATQTDKSWFGAGVDFSEVLERVRGADPRVAIQLELQGAFGLRSEEARKLRPKADLMQKEEGSFLGVRAGTKGGKYRTVPVIEPHQWEVLKRAAEFVGHGCCVPRGMTEKQWDNHVRWVLRKLGINKKVLGVVPHGLRHEYTHERYQKILKEPVPVKGGGRPSLPREDYRRGRRQISEELGHSRVSVVTCYSGGSHWNKKHRGNGLGRSVLEDVMIQGSGSVIQRQQSQLVGVSCSDPGQI